MYLPATLPADKYPVQVGFSASSRHFPRAVDRNRVKRLGREAWRLQKQFLYDHLRGQSRQLAVFLIYTDKKIAPFPVLHQKISVILERLKKETGQNPGKI
ncbi:hypothetical protein GCM10009415_13840 [Chitinophaga japonensis]